eukprot:4442143-Heterocapsa_arctica.AAC.1
MNWEKCTGPMAGGGSCCPQVAGQKLAARFEFWGAALPGGGLIPPRARGQSRGRRDAANVGEDAKPP